MSKYRICDACGTERRSRGCLCNAVERYNLQQAIVILQAMQYEEEVRAAGTAPDWAF